MYFDARAAAFEWKGLNGNLNICVQGNTEVQPLNMMDKS